LQPVRDSLIDERLTRVFQSYAASYKEQGRAADAERHDDYLTSALLARRPAGFFSIELGKILVLIEDRGMPDRALERLAKLPENVRQTPDVRYLRVRALVESARMLAAQRLSAEALHRIEQAWVEAQALEQRWAPLQIETRELLDLFAREEAARLKQENRADEAIDLLERLYELSKGPVIREYACILCCNLGFQKLEEKEFDQARSQFMKALRMDSGYTRARQAISDIAGR
jgi:tetratricopeptide (TPR) repeat protein